MLVIYPVISDRRGQTRAAAHARTHACVWAPAAVCGAAASVKWQMVGGSYTGLLNEESVNTADSGAALLLLLLQLLNVLHYWQV